VLWNGSDGESIACDYTAESGRVTCDTDLGFVNVEDGQLILSVSRFTPDTVEATL
jgi:hypothetical protein